MFSRNQRYSFNKGFPAKSINCDFFNLKYQKNDKGNYFNAFVVPGKIDKRSVVRHKIKRRYANALREILKNKDISYDLVFFIKKTSMGKKYGEIKQEIINVLTKTDILRSEEKSF